MKLIDVSDDTVIRLRESIAAELPAYLADLATLVGVDCGSYTKGGVDQVGRWTATAFRELGASVQVHPNAELGDTVVATLRGHGTGSVLVIGHLDTVYEPGAAAARPFRVEGDRAYGPGSPT
jgi:glutamate carboxypeptidase